MFTFTLLVPPEQLDKSSISSCLLTFENDVTILADPGWDLKTDLSYLESIITSVDLIVLSHPTMQFIGAYAYLFKKNPLLRKIPVYSTSPISNLGRTETIEAYRTAGLVGPIVNYQLEIDDIEEAFDRITPLKHNQSTTLRGNYENLVITAINAGHTLGGVMWLFNNKHNEKVLYAPAWNHSRDSYLEGAKLLQDNGNALPLLMRPSVLITSAMIGSSMSYNKRVEKFLGLVDATLQNSGTVLLPVSLGSRFLELVHLIDDHLRSLPYQVYLLAKTGTRALTYAGSMFEWMSPSVTQGWQSRGKQPFTASTVTVIDHNELSSLTGSKVVFCYGETLDKGTPALEAFLRLCNDPTTTILLTERAEKGSLASDLYEMWERAAAARNNGKAEDGVVVPYQSNFSVTKVVEEPLIGHELEEYTNEVKRKRESAKEFKAKLEVASSATTDEDELLKMDKKILQDDDDDEDEDEDEDINENDAKAQRLKISSKEKEENLKENLPLDIDVKSAKGKNRMFPTVIKKRRFDEYGEVINAKDFAKDSTDERRFLSLGKSKIGEKRTFGQDSQSSRKMMKKETQSDEMTELDALHEPKKQIDQNVQVSTKCGLIYVDMAGLVDLRSLSLMIPALRPRKLLLMRDLTNSNNFSLVYGQLNSVNFNRSKMLTAGLSGSNKLFELIEVRNNKEIKIEDKISTFEVLLEDKLANSLKWQRITGGYSVAQVTGIVVKRSEIEQQEKENGNAAKIEEVKEEDKMDVDPEADKAENADEDFEKLVQKNGLGLKAVSEASSHLQNIRHTPLAIGDIRLKELKDAYSASNEHKAEFKGEGTLVIDEKICIKKISEGDFVVEGTPCKLFYEVRERVRNMLAYV